MGNIRLIEAGIYFDEESEVDSNMLVFDNEKAEEIGNYKYSKEWPIIDIRKKLGCGVDSLCIEDLQKIKMPSDAQKPDTQINLIAGSNPILIKGVKNIHFTRLSIKDSRCFSHYIANLPQGFNVLYCHGKDGKYDRNPPMNAWMLKKDSNKEFRDIPVPQIIRMIEKEEPIDVIHICNAGGYQDSVLEDKIYCLTKVMGAVSIYHGKVVDEIRSYDSVSKLIIPEKFLKISRPMGGNKNWEI